jgi:hypothetical protein
MRNELTVTFKRVTPDMVGTKAKEKISVIFYNRREGLHASGYSEGDFLDDEDIWYCPISEFEPKPKTADEYLDTFMESNEMKNITSESTAREVWETFAQFIIDQERGKDENS